MAITEEQPPFDTEANLKEYLARQFRAAKQQDDNAEQTTTYTALPDKLNIGKVYYFLNAVAATPITGEGLWLYKSTGWILLG